MGVSAISAASVKEGTVVEVGGLTRSDELELEILSAYKENVVRRSRLTFCVDIAAVGVFAGSVRRMQRCLSF